MDLILRLCSSCVFYNEETGTCRAFPDGVPLKSGDTHFNVLPGQVGDDIYEMDKAKMNLFEAYQRTHPEIRFPVFISYEVPDVAEGETFTQQDVTVEEE